LFYYDVYLLWSIFVPIYMSIQSAERTPTSYYHLRPICFLRHGLSTNAVLHPRGRSWSSDAVVTGLMTKVAKLAAVLLLILIVATTNDTD